MRSAAFARRVAAGCTSLHTLETAFGMLGCNDVRKHWIQVKNLKHTHKLIMIQHSLIIVFSTQLFDYLEYK